MNKFKLIQNPEKFSSINRTIRIPLDVFDHIEALSDETGLSFNRIVVQCIDYALSHLDCPPISAQQP